MICSRDRFDTEKIVNVNRLTFGSIEAAFFRGIEALALLLMTVVLTQTLEPSDFGQISYSLFLLNVLGLIAPVGFTTSSLRFVPEYKGDGRFSLLKGFVYRAIQISFITALIISGISFIAVSVWLIDKPYAYSLFWAAVLLPTVAVSQIRRKISEGAGWIRQSVFPDLVPPLLMILIIKIFFINDINIVYLAFLATSVFGVIIGFGGIRKNLLRPEDSTIATYKNELWLKVSLPLMAAGLGSVLMNRIDVLVLGVYAEMSEVGYYSAASRIAILTSFFLNAVYIVVAPRLTIAYVNGRHHEFRLHLRRATQIASIGGGVAIIPLLVWPEKILGIFGESYAEGSKILILLALSQLVHAVLGIKAIALTLIGGQVIYAYTMIVGIIINLLGCIMVAPKWAGEGVATVTLFTALIVKASQVFFLNKRLKEVHAGSPYSSDK